jgi:Mg/Co/Ni transporter MgtE
MALNASGPEIRSRDGDPAVASSPFVTTVTDIVGFFSFLAIATLWFGLK